MTTQITVRLPGEDVAFLDEQVENGQTRSRAAALAAMIMRERHRVRAEADIAILRERGDYDFGNLGGSADLSDLD